METVNWMYLLDPEGMLKILELVCKNIHRGNVKFNADPSNLIASQQHDFFMNRIIFFFRVVSFSQPMKMKAKSKTTNQITDFCNAIIHKSVFFLYYYNYIHTILIQTKVLYSAVKYIESSNWPYLLWHF